MSVEKLNPAKSVELINESLPYINLDPEETDPFTLVMNMRFWRGLLGLDIDWEEKYWKVPSKLLPLARKALSMHERIELRFLSIDWSRYIGKYGVDPRNYSYPAAVWNVPTARNFWGKSESSFSSMAGSSYSNVENNYSEVEELRHELERKNGIIGKLKERCNTLERQYNEAVSGRRSQNTASSVVV